MIFFQISTYKPVADALCFDKKVTPHQVAHIAYPGFRGFVHLIRGPPRLLELTAQDAKALGNSAQA